MRTIKNVFLLTLMIHLLNSCTESSANFTQPTDPITLKFNEYLKQNYGDSIGDKAETYVLVNRKATRERIAFKLSKLKNVLGNTKIDHMIVSSAVSIPDSLLLSSSMITDWDGEVDHLDLLYSAVTVIRTSNGIIRKKDDVQDQDENYWKEFFR